MAYFDAYWEEYGFDANNLSRHDVERAFYKGVGRGMKKFRDSLWKKCSSANKSLKVILNEYVVLFNLERWTFELMLHSEAQPIIQKDDDTICWCFAKDLFPKRVIYVYPEQKYSE